VLNEALLASLPNRLVELLPNAVNLASAIRVIDAHQAGDHGDLCLNVDSVRQEAVCYVEAPKAGCGGTTPETNA
jgi:hypothetical protein